MVWILLIKPKPIYNKSYSSFTLGGDHRTKYFQQGFNIKSIEFILMATLS